MTARFHFIGLVVADMPTTLAFYRRLGLDIPVEHDTEPHVEHQLPGGPLLVFDTTGTILSFDPSWTPPVGGSRAALSFMCDDPADVDAIYSDIVGAGYEGHLDPWDAFWGQRYATLHDPDGNGIDLFAALPVSA